MSVSVFVVQWRERERGWGGGDRGREGGEREKENMCVCVCVCEVLESLVVIFLRVRTKMSLLVTSVWLHVQYSTPLHTNLWFRLVYILFM